MKKLFFSRSYNGGKNNPVPPPATTDEQCYSNNLLAKQPKNQDEKNPVLRRSLSFSSAACQQKNFSCLSDRSRSPSTTSSSGYPQQSDFPARWGSLSENMFLFFLIKFHLLFFFNFDINVFTCIPKRKHIHINSQSSLIKGYIIGLWTENK